MLAAINRFDSARDLVRRKRCIEENRLELSTADTSILLGDETSSRIDTVWSLRSLSVVLEGD